MIIVYHNNDDVVTIVNANGEVLNVGQVNKESISYVLVKIAKEYPDELLLWCHQTWKEQFNIFEAEKLFHHKKMLLSYNPSDTSFFDAGIGYVDTSLFVQANREVTFATWQMSSAVGGIHASVVLALKDKISFDKDFNYFLCSLAKLTMEKGLMCYSEPELLKQQESITTIKSSTFTLFKFVKQHYRTRWVFLLLFNVIVYERRFPFFSFLFSFLYKNRTRAGIDLNSIEVQSSKKVLDKGTIDVIIPTIGRKSYLYEVLQDLSQQTYLPKKLIIVEQNPKEGSSSELDYLETQKWPFEIKHIFTHQAGACNARNLALAEVENEWTFFADDDIRIKSDFIQKALENLNKFGIKAASLGCYQKGQKKSYTTIFQWIAFGAGCSFVYSNALKECKFNMGYEFGFGEDSDFGMQVRNKGCDVLFFPEPEILHLKAPIGGFRTKPVQQWQNDIIQPKPSPTVMLYQILHHSRTQISSYKTTLFFKYYKSQKIKNPIRYYFYFQKQWERSVFWANELNKQNEI